MRFGIIGAAGYVAPRHMAAIVEHGGEIVTACDISDSVGVLDSYAPNARFCTDPEYWFDYELSDVDVVVVCTPNHLHRRHMTRALEAQCNVLLEKPPHISGDPPLRPPSHWLAKRFWVCPVLQLRYHPMILERSWKTAHPHLRWFEDVQIQYEVYRGDWYRASWKGDMRKSGGLLMNLGIHLFDLAIYMFGKVLDVEMAHVGERHAGGSILFEQARVTWSLKSDSVKPRRVFRVNGFEIDMTSEIGTLHSEVYRRVINGEQLHTLSDALPAIQLVDDIRRIANA